MIDEASGSDEPARAPGTRGGRGKKERGNGRLEALSDGVFAVAITLLVFNLKIPSLPGPQSLSASWLATQLWSEWPAYLAFTISFATILVMWVNHHRIFRLVRGSSPAFVFVNGFLLMLIALTPFPTAILSEYFATPASATACAVYSGFFIFINIGFTALWQTAVHQRRLLERGLPPKLIQSVSRRNLLGLPGYSAAFIAAFWLPGLSLAICLLLWIYWAIGDLSALRLGVSRLRAALPRGSAREVQQ
jgi:uncharacterized membrane protein